MPHSPERLVSEAEEVLEDCQDLLDETIEFVRSIPADREELHEEYVAAHKDTRRAEADWERLYFSEKASDRQIEVAEQNMRRAEKKSNGMWKRLTGPRYDIEYQKIVARQIASLMREESHQRLTSIAARSKDPQVHKAVEEHKDQVAISCNYVIKMFPEGSGAELHQPDLAQARKARAEATEVLTDFRERRLSN